MATGEHAGRVTLGAPDLGGGEAPEGAPKSMHWLQEHSALSNRLVSCSRRSFCSGNFSDHSRVAQHSLAPGSLVCRVLSHPSLPVSSAVRLQSAHSGDPFCLPRLWGPAFSSCLPTSAVSFRCHLNWNPRLPGLSGTDRFLLPLCHQAGRSPLGPY